MIVVRVRDEHVAVPIQYHPIGSVEPCVDCWAAIAAVNGRAGLRSGRLLIDRPTV